MARGHYAEDEDDEFAEGERYRVHRGSDPWGRNSYRIPYYAVAGSSDTGMSYDSPAPSDRVHEELQRFRDFLQTKGIESEFGQVTHSGNIFMGKQWVVVAPKDYRKARLLASKWLAEHNYDTRYIHDAD